MFREIEPLHFVYRFRAIVLCHFSIQYTWLSYLFLPTIQLIYLKSLFLWINPYTIFTCQQLYLVMIRSMITCNFIFITESGAIYRTYTVILVSLMRERLLQPWEFYISHSIWMFFLFKQKELNWSIEIKMQT